MSEKLKLKIHRRQTRELGGDWKNVVGPPYSRQRDVIDLIFRDTSDLTKCVDLCCGIGFGKTTLAIDVAQIMLNLGPEQRGLFLEPDVPSLDRIFLTEWFKCVPDHLYILNEGKRKITWLPTGAVLYYAPRVVTGSKARQANRLGRGPNLSFVIDDESAIDFNTELYINLHGRLRLDVPFRLFLTVSTPQLGPYTRMLKMDGHEVIRGTSFDNPALDRDWIEQKISMMSHNQAQREIYGKEVALTDNPWGIVDLEKMHPKGNLHPHEWDPSMDYTLCCDIGRKSAWLLLQHLPVLDEYGWNATGRTIDVAVAEYTPVASNTESLVHRINTEYGKPAQIIIGADAGTQDTNSGVSAIKLFRAAGWDCKVRPVTGIWAQKILQHHAADRALLNANGHRQFCISTELQSHEQNNCGIREVLEQDQWPDPSKPGYFEKDKPRLGSEALEDMRDAWMYGMTLLHKIEPHKQPGPGLREAS